MKFKKPSGSTIESTAVNIGGGLIGAAVSRGVFGVIHTPKATIADEIKKEKTMATVKRVAIVAAAGALAASIDGNDTLSALVKSVATGMAIGQGLDLVKTLVEDTPTATKLSTSTNAAGKFAARALGLSCPCDGLGRTRRRNRQLRGFVPTSDFASNGQASLNGVQSAIDAKVNQLSQLAAA